MVAFNYVISAILIRAQVSAALDIAFRVGTSNWHVHQSASGAYDKIVAFCSASIVSSALIVIITAQECPVMTKAKVRARVAGGVEVVAGWPKVGARGPSTRATRRPLGNAGAANESGTPKSPHFAAGVGRSCQTVEGTRLQIE